MTLSSVNERETKQTQTCGQTEEHIDLSGLLTNITSLRSPDQMVRRDALALKF